jgi:hypothetical protein
MIYLPATFHVPSSNGLIVIAIKPKDKEMFRTSAMLLFYILGKELPQQKLHVYRGSLW